MQSQPSHAGIERRTHTEAAMETILIRNSEAWARLRGLIAQLALAPAHGSRWREVDIQIKPEAWVPIISFHAEIVGTNGSSDVELVYQRVNGEMYVFALSAGVPDWRPVARAGKRSYISEASR